MVPGVTRGVGLLVDYEVIGAAWRWYQGEEIGAVGRCRQLAVHIVEVLVAAQVIVFVV